MCLYDGELIGFTISAALMGTVIDYQESFSEYWALNSDSPPEFLTDVEWEEFKSLHVLSKELMEAAILLTNTSHLSDDEIAHLDDLKEKFLQEQAPLDNLYEQFQVNFPENREKIIRDPDSWYPDEDTTKFWFLESCLELEAVDQFYIEPMDIIRRVQTLLRYLVDNPGSLYKKYLSRVSRCYLYDMHPEFAVMCRAALESAICQIAEDDEIKGVIGDRRCVTLTDRINYCISKEIFNEEEEAAARLVKSSGDNAIHSSPTLKIDPDEILAGLTKSLNALQKS
ncbi:hypothetical protein ACFL6T_03005 [Candidatus Zixiibacteriota bacterium]